MEMMVGKIFKVDYNASEENENFLLQTIITNIPKKDCAMHFCDYVKNTEINNLKGIEKVFLYKLRNNFKSFYLRLDMELSYSNFTKEELFEVITEIRHHGTSSLESIDNEYLFSDFMQFSDDKAYEAIKDEMIAAFNYAIIEGPRGITNMNLDLLYYDRKECVKRIQDAESIIKGCKDYLIKIDSEIANLEKQS